MPVVPCGQVWQELMMNPPISFAHQNFLYVGQEIVSSGTIKYIDNIHQNDLGKVVNALCFYSMLTHRSPIGLYFTAEEFVDGHPLLEGHSSRMILDAFAPAVWKIIAQREPWAASSAIAQQPLKPLQQSTGLVPYKPFSQHTLQGRTFSAPVQPRSFSTQLLVQQSSTGATILCPLTGAAAHP
jgi:hypothetical protein